MEEGRNPKDRAIERYEEKNMLRKEFNILKDKFKLTNFEELNSNFEIENIDPDSNILREITREIHETVEFYSRILEGLIQPDSKLCDMKEAGSLSEEDHEIITELYRKCMLINRELLLANLDFDADKAAKEIIRKNEEWNEMKKDLRIILTKMRDTWKQESKKETYGGYYG